MHSGNLLPIPLDSILSKISASQRRLFKEFQWPLDKLKPVSLLLAKKHRHLNPDKMFFSFEELPAFGKEYWFLYLADAHSGRQFIATFGRGQGAVKINRRLLKASAGKPFCDLAAVYWSLGNGKRAGDFTSTFKASHRKTNRLEDASHLSFAGSYPNYFFSLKDKAGEVCSVRLSRRRAGRPHEFGHFSTSVFGFELINIFLRFNGRLYGKPFSGDAYVQKVVAAGPFVPWNWLRIYWPDHSYLDYFSLRFLPTTQWGTVRPANAEFFDARTKKNRIIKNASLSFEPQNKTWVLLDSEANLLLRLKPLAKHRFLFKSAGTFRYDQFFIEAYDEETDGARLAGRPLGQGTGLLEDAHGFML